MIENVKDKAKYEKYNKIYIPKEYIKNTYKYNFNGDYIVIRTNNNCRTSNSYQYCNCYYYNWKNNVISVPYECNYTSSVNYTIAFEQITDDLNHSEYIQNIYFNTKTITWSIFVLGILFAIFVTKERRY